MKRKGEDFFFFLKLRKGKNKCLKFGREIENGFVYKNNGINGG